MELTKNSLRASRAVERYVGAREPKSECVGGGGGGGGDDTWCRAECYNTSIVARFLCGRGGARQPKIIRDVKLCNKIVVVWNQKYMGVSAVTRRGECAMCLFS